MIDPNPNNSYKTKKNLTGFPRGFSQRGKPEIRIKAENVSHIYGIRIR